jgi:hypothetical protein
MKTQLLTFSAALALFAAVSTSYGQAPAKAEKIQFKPGSTVAKKSGTVRGRATLRYQIAAKPGMNVSVDLKSKSTFVYFNILDPKTGFALETDPEPREVTKWSGKLPQWGSYVIEVYLVRAAARRGQTAKFDLTVRVKP